MPMVRRRDRNRIDGRILEQPSNVAKRSRMAPDFSASLVEDGLVDVTERSHFDVRKTGKRVQVVLPAISKTADRDAHTVAGAKHALRSRQECQPPERGPCPRR